MGLIDVALVLFFAVAVLLVMVGDALARVLVAAARTLGRVPGRARRLIRSGPRHETMATDDEQIDRPGYGPRSPLASQ